MDNKYGQIFTKQDLCEFVEALERLQNENATLGRYPEEVIVDKVLDEMRGFRLPPNEPLFILRGQDRYALPAIGHYLEMCKVADLSEGHVNAVDKAWHDFEDYFEENPDRVKDPD